MTSETENKAFANEDESGLENGSTTYKYNGNVGEPSVFASKEDAIAAEDEEDKSREYGWFSFRPKFLQVGAAVL